MAKITEFGHVRLPDEEYFGLHAVSNSKLTDLCASPLQYWASWRTTWKETDAMRFGKLFHCLLLEPEEFPLRYFLIDPAERPDKSKGMTATVNKEWQEMLIYREAMAGRQPYDLEDLEKCERMKEAVYREVSAWALLDEPGLVEHAYTWQEEVEYYSPKRYRMQQAVVEMKLKADKWLRSSGILLDLKTTNDASPKWWDRHAWEFGYHRQAAIYYDHLEGVEEYYVLAVETVYPYNVALYKAEPAVLEKGRHNEPYTADPGWGYKPLLKRLCQLREMHGSEFYFGEDAKPWPMYGYWARREDMGVLKWRPPLWA